MAWQVTSCVQIRVQHCGADTQCRNYQGLSIGDSLDPCVHAGASDIVSICVNVAADCTWQRYVATVTQADERYFASFIRTRAFHTHQIV